jgi:hypothetical protein
MRNHLRLDSKLLSIKQGEIVNLWQKKLSYEQEKQICNMYQLEQSSVLQISKFYNACHGTIYKRNYALDNGKKIL